MKENTAIFEWSIIFGLILLFLATGTLLFWQEVNKPGPWDKAKMTQVAPVSTASPVTMRTLRKPDSNNS